jgi:AcrR family transcriptional regulator
MEMASKQAVEEILTESPIDESLGGVRPMRADARRNRERLVSAAREVFAEQGSGASMEAIAKQAGVGVGTLYRHFPNRFDIVEAVYQDDVEELVHAAERATEELEPWEAVEAFFEAFLRYAKTKQALLSELQQAFEKNPELRSRMRERIDAAFDLVVERAKEAGVVREDVSGHDLTQLVSPICTNASIPDDQMRRLIKMILDGMAATASAGAR